jgi:antirestriction protein ArdC
MRWELGSCLALSAVLASPLSAVEAAPTITVFVYNYAAIPSEELAKAKAEASRIYRHGGVEIEWLGVRPWVKPWDAEHAAGRISRPLRHNGQPYSGINILMLWAASVAEGFVAPIWMTYRQATELGAHVRKGEKGNLVVYANSITRTEDNGAGEETEREIHFMKGYTVFNVEQIEGLPSHYYAKPQPRFENAPERIAHAEGFFAATGADIRHRGGQAYYAQGGDYIQLPPIEAFRDAGSYYATLAHEGVHWTKHPSRLGRELGRKTWGDEGYAARNSWLSWARLFCAPTSN